MKKPAAIHPPLSVVEPPPLVIVEGEDKVSFAIHVNGAAALALRLGAEMDGDSLLVYLTEALAFQTASALADTNPRETPAYAELFGLEVEATK